MTKHILWTQQTQKTSESTCIIGHLDQLQAYSDTLLQAIPETAAPLWSHLLDQLSPGDSHDSAETWLAGDAPHRLFVGALPTSCSRHNSPAHPHAITSLLGDFGAGDAHASLIVLLDCPKDALAASCAIARAFPLYSQKTKDKTKSSLHVTLLHKGEPLASTEGLPQACEATQLAARLVDTPTNELNTTRFIEEAKRVAEQTKSQITIIQGEALKEQGFGGLWGVGQAATHPPALVLLTHEPTPSPDSQTIVWVGKGIVYDTGGLSIKTKTGMPGMKTDMGGAAAVLGAFSAAAALDLPHTLHAVLCLAENAIGPNATRPDDILTLYSGKTVEINNTDAEGRLVLGDGVAYASKHLQPDIIVDLATLTGAQLVATGRKHAGIMSNDEDLERQAVQAGRQSGDLVHPLPYCPEFFRGEFKSQVADMKNSVKDRANAQSSCAGQFVGEHLVDYDKAWLHIDLAGPGRNQERATGYGVALLLTLAGFTSGTNESPWHTPESGK
jgi:probable aminopeptidase NPEPL1